MNEGDVRRLAGQMYDRLHGSRMNDEQQRAQAALLILNLTNEKAALLEMLHSIARDVIAFDECTYPTNVCGRDFFDGLRAKADAALKKT